MLEIRRLVLRARWDREAALLQRLDQIRLGLFEFFRKILDTHRHAGTLLVAAHVRTDRLEKGWQVLVVPERLEIVRVLPLLGGGDAVQRPQGLFAGEQ